jgi:hypothetical protein
LVKWLVLINWFSLFDVWGVSKVMTLTIYRTWCTSWRYTYLNWKGSKTREWISYIYLNLLLQMNPDVSGQGLNAAILLSYVVTNKQEMFCRIHHSFRCFTSSCLQASFWYILGLSRKQKFFSSERLYIAIPCGKWGTNWLIDTQRACAKIF